MLFVRIPVEGLAHNSYLLASERTGETIVIDPRRDVDVYLEFARQRGLQITHAIETHIHADFVSGARELAATGAECVCGPGADLGFDHREVRHGETMPLGEMQLKFLHTPGHTPEHISILVQAPDAPPRLFTGDTLFVGAVGRPDLLGEEWTRRLASDLYDSLFGKLLRLDDGVEVQPGHGAGSLCGRAIGSALSSSIGLERRGNPMLKVASKDAFVRAVLADLPETPPYFPRMKRINREGPPLRHLSQRVAPPPVLNAKNVAALLSHGAVLLDLRDGDAFAAAHPAGALNLPFGARVGYWAGWVLPEGTRVVLLSSNAGEAADVVRQLLRVGFDEVLGYLEGGFEAWRAAGLPTESLARIPVEDAQKMVAEKALDLLDVRSLAEWRADHIEGAVYVPLHELAANPGRWRDSPRLATICESGYRSSLASSILARSGIASANVAGGMSALRTQS